MKRKNVFVFLLAAALLLSAGCSFRDRGAGSAAPDGGAEREESFAESRSGDAEAPAPTEDGTPYTEVTAAGEDEPQYLWDGPIEIMGFGSPYDMLNYLDSLGVRVNGRELFLGSAQEADETFGLYFLRVSPIYDLLDLSGFTSASQTDDAEDYLNIFLGSYLDLAAPDRVPAEYRGEGWRYIGEHPEAVGDLSDPAQIRFSPCEEIGGCLCVFPFGGERVYAVYSDFYDDLTMFCSYDAGGDLTSVSFCES